MNRQTVSKDQKPESPILLSATEVLQRKINRNNFETTVVDTRIPSEQWIDKPRLPNTESQFNHDFSKIPVSLNSSYPIQAKLKIGQPDDKYEQEADRVAEQVMRMPDPHQSSSVGGLSLTDRTIHNNGTIQRACATCSAEYKSAEDEARSVRSANLCPKCRNSEQGLVQTKSVVQNIQRQENEIEEEEDEELIQTKTTGGVTPVITSTINSDIQSLQGGGQPLSGSERSFFEPRFGADFSNVRVHNDTRAANAAQSVNARAFTLGHNVVFGAGEYSPDALAGRKLLAHELTHVVQQRATGPAIQRQPRAKPAIPTGIKLEAEKQQPWANMAASYKSKYKTHLKTTTSLRLLPKGDYKHGCAKEYLTVAANTCPSTGVWAKRKVCTGNKCLTPGQYGKLGGVKDGPDVFLDQHRTKTPMSLLKGTGKNQCSEVCHQRFAFRTDANPSVYHPLGSFFIIRNFKASTWTPPGKTAEHITIGTIRKIAAQAQAPSKQDFAKKIAPGLVKSGHLTDPPPTSTRPVP